MNKLTNWFPSLWTIYLHRKWDFLRMIKTIRHGAIGPPRILTKPEWDALVAADEDCNYAGDPWHCWVCHGDNAHALEFNDLTLFSICSKPACRAESIS